MQPFSYNINALFFVVLPASCSRASPACFPLLIDTSCCFSFLCLIIFFHRALCSSHSLQMRACMLEVNAHTEPCKALCFVNEAIVTGSPDCSILVTDVDSGIQIARMENSHGAAVNRIVNLTELTIASGDGEGCIKVWDTRQHYCCNSFSVHEEYISDMTFASDSMKLIGTSGDRTLSFKQEATRFKLDQSSLRMNCYLS